MEKCSECGQECELIRGNRDEICCLCWIKDPLNVHHQCNTCKKERKRKAKEYKRRRKVTDFISMPPPQPK